MQNNEYKYPIEPFGRIMGKISRMLLTDIQHKLAHLDIERSYYPLLLIEAANGNLTQKELTLKLSCNKVQTVRIIDYLTSFGYVVRVRNKNDHRKYNLEITGKAKTILPDIKKAINEAASTALTGVTENKVDELYVLLRKIENNLINNKRGRIND